MKFMQPGYKVMDKVLIKGLRVTAIIGIHDYERTTPQELVIDITLFTDLHLAAETDDINHCVNYQTVAEKVKAHTEMSKRLTVEALAEDIARICLEIPKVSRVIIRVEKTQAIAYTDAVGVEIERGNG
jgi:FolB domain-containing protein